MKKILFALIALMLIACSCTSLPGRRMIDKASDLGVDEVVVAGRVIVHPEFTRDEQDLTGAGAEDYRNVMLLLNNTIYKRINASKTQALTGMEWGGMIRAKVGDTFYTVFKKDGPIYILSGAVCTKYYWVTIPGTTTWTNMNGMMVMNTTPPRQELRTKFEYIPFNYKIEISPEDRAVYIGDIHVYRDEFNKITKIAVADNYKKQAEDFNKKFSGMKLKKAFAKKAPDSELIQPTDADNFMGSGSRTSFGGGYAICMNGISGGFIYLDAAMGYQFSRNILADISATIMVQPDFLGFNEKDFGNGVTLGTMHFPLKAALKYFIFDGTFSPYAVARLGAAFDMNLGGAMDSFLSVYFVADLGLGLRLSLDTSFDLMLEADMLFYNMIPCLIVPKLVLVF